MLAELLVAVVTAGLVLLLVQRSRNQVLTAEDGWWGPGAPSHADEDVSLRPFEVRTSDEELQDLYSRMDRTRPVPSLEDSQFHYGFNSRCLQDVVSYWRRDFDWGRQVRQLNRYPHFRTRIQGIDVHYVHVKPQRVAEGAAALPIILVHGWPGSFYEFYRLIPLLTEPENPEEPVFEVVCPSIPGYGFSEAPHKQGFDSVCAASVFHQLMKRLGFQQFFAHGGDWGWQITTNMAQLDPGPGLLVVLSLAVGRLFPALVGFTDAERRRLYPCGEKLLLESVKESGYLHIQATKPDTAGRALNDSPVGLAAYILEKFSTWTNQNFRDLEDGGLTRRFSLDDLLTNVMIYWTSGCITSSMRFYKENFGKGLDQPHSRIPVNVPTGFACSPNDVMPSPELWVRQKYRNLIRYTHMPRGGHFAAMEEPQLMAEDIREFAKAVERMIKRDGG